MSEADPPIAEQPDDKKQRKKAKKTREAWISFAGRVVDRRRHGQRAARHSRGPPVSEGARARR
jgi:hypothetical protein